MRIHIGRISPALADRIGELEQRLDRYGPRTSPLTLHKKEFGDFYFAFVDMDLDRTKYGMLRTGLHGVTFRQSKLEIKEARPKYTALMDVGAQGDAPLNPEQLKRARSAPRRRIDVYPGRERSGVREEPTFRVKMKGELRKPKMRKRKLWGIEKRPLAKLTHYFVDGEWRDAENKAIEVVAALHDEHAQAQRIAEDLARQSAYLSDSDFEDFKETARDIGEADSDNEIELVPRNAPQNTREAPRNTLVDVEMSDEADEADAEPETNTHVTPNENTTEALRSALGVEAPFTLFGAAEPEPEPMVIEPVSAPAPAPPKLGLFFEHKASPYLRSQSQTAKLVGDFDAKAWEAEFFEHRGEWNRNLRKRRRDAVRMARRMGKKRGEH